MVGGVVVEVGRGAMRLVEVPCSAIELVEVLFDVDEEGLRNLEEGKSISISDDEDGEELDIGCIDEVLKVTKLEELVLVEMKLDTVGVDESSKETELEELVLVEMKLDTGGVDESLKETELEELVLGEVKLDTVGVNETSKELEKTTLDEGVTSTENEVEVLGIIGHVICLKGASPLLKASRLSPPTVNCTSVENAGMSLLPPPSNTSRLASLSFMPWNMTTSTITSSHTVVAETSKQVLPFRSA